MTTAHGPGGGFDALAAAQQILTATGAPPPGTAPVPGQAARPYPPVQDSLPALTPLVPQPLSR